MEVFQNRELKFLQPLSSAWGLPTAAIALNRVNVSNSTNAIKDATVMLLP